MFSYWRLENPIVIHKMTRTYEQVDITGLANYPQE